jgi:hypothetical protein
MIRVPSGSISAEYRTSVSRAIGALCLGAILGASIVTADYVRTLLQTFGREHVQQYGLRKSAIIFAAAAMVWFVGLAVVGTPFWSLFHRLGWRRWPAAMALGAILSFVVSLGIFTAGFGVIPPAPGSSFSASDSGGPTVINNKLTAHGWARALNDALLLGACGTAVGWVVWRTAYRRSR